jgi:hypothetical protein
MGIHLHDSTRKMETPVPFGMVCCYYLLFIQYGIGVLFEIASRWLTQLEDEHWNTSCCHAKLSFTFSFVLKLFEKIQCHSRDIEFDKKEKMLDPRNGRKMCFTVLAIS